MNKYFVFGLIALCVASASAGRLPREAAATTPSSLSKIVDGVEDAFGKLHSSFLELMGVKDNSELVNLVDTQSRAYATKLQGVVTDLSEEAKKNSGSFNGIIDEFKAKVSATISDIQAKNPELVTDSKKYQEQFEAQMRNVMSETEKFREKLQTEGGPVFEKFGKVAKDLYETTVTTANTYTKQVENTLKENKN